VLALIEGPTLADRIETGPLLQDEAVAIAKQVIDALEYAHDRGVVHRDLKSANVKITSEDVVKVLDVEAMAACRHRLHRDWAFPLRKRPALRLARTANRRT
jgi:serine/threonine protein kinase